MPAPEQEVLNESLRHRTRQLAVSMHFGPFFRDGRYYLLSDQPPGDLNLLENPRGEPIHPGESLGILPAGTRVRVKEVEFATASATTNRSLLTPRFFTWVLVEAPGLDRPAVLVIRDEPDTHEKFLEILSRHLTDEDVARRKARYPEEVRLAIEEKRLVEGMEEAAVQMAWGVPVTITRGFEEGVQVDSWRFEGGRRALVRGGRLVSWSHDDEEG